MTKFQLKGVIAISLASAALATTSSTAMAAAGTAAVVYNAMYKSYSDGIVTRLDNAGYAVTQVADFAALGDLASYDQIWDFRISNPLQAGEITDYVTYLQSPKGLFLLGEHSGFQPRNDSIVDFLHAAGGGSVALAAGVSYVGQYITPGFNGNGEIAPDSATMVVYNSGGGFSDPGTGYFIATSGPNETGNGTGLAFGAGSLANALPGRVMTVLDINMFNQPEWGSYGMALLDRMIAFSAGSFQADPDLPPAGGSSTVIDNSQASFDLASDAAQQPTITFDGGQLDMTGGADSVPTVDKDIDIQANGAFVNTAGAAGVINGTITGQGSLFAVGGGSLALNAANSYQGGTVADGTTLLVQNPAALSTGGVQLIGGMLVLDQGYSFANNIQLSGNNVIMTATGVTTLSGNVSGTGTLSFFGNANFTGSSTHSGMTSIDSGRLAVNGAMPNSTVVAGTGARIGGNGLVGGLIVRTNAIAAPGNSIGTLNAASTVLFEADSIFEVEANAAGQADRINAAGLVTIEGGIVSVLAENGNYRPRTNYVILASDTGIDGNFANVTSNLAFLDPTLSYSGNQVQLTLTRNDIRFADVAATRNQRAVAVAVDGSADPDSPLFDALVGSDATQARRGFDSLSGEVNASALTVAASDAGTMLRSISRRTERTGVAGKQLWTELNAGRSRFDNDGNAASIKADRLGFIVGFETGNDTVLVGVAGGYSDTDAKIADRASKADVKSVHAAAYAAGDLAPVKVRGGLSYSDFKIDTDRSAGAGALSQALSARIDGRAIQAFGEVGHELKLGLGSIEPFAGINGLWLRNKAFAEQGGTLALRGASRNHDQLWSTLGVKAGFALGAASPLSLHVKTGWQHALNDKAMTSRLAFASGGDAFDVAGVPLARNAVLLDTRLDWQATTGLSLSAGYSGSIANQGTAHAAKAAIAFRF